MLSKEEILEKLKKIAIFKDFTDADPAWPILFNVLQQKEVKAGDNIIVEEEVGAEMFILYSGEVEIQKKTRAGDVYTVTCLPSEMNIFFGELALIDDDRRSATVKANQDCVLFSMKKDDFIKMGNDHPEIGLLITRAISKILSSRLRKTTQDMITLFDALVVEVGG